MLVAVAMIIRISARLAAAAWFLAFFAFHAVVVCRTILACTGVVLRVNRIMARKSHAAGVGVHCFITTDLL